MVTSPNQPNLPEYVLPQSIIIPNLTKLTQPNLI